MKDKIIKLIQDLPTIDQVDIWNEYCDINQEYDFAIYENGSMFFSQYFSDDPYEAIEFCYNGNYKLEDKYLIIDNDKSAIYSYRNKEVLEIINYDKLADDLLNGDIDEYSSSIRQNTLDEIIKIREEE